MNHTRPCSASHHLVPHAPVAVASPWRARAGLLLALLVLAAPLSAAENSPASARKVAAHSGGRNAAVHVPSLALTIDGDSAIAAPARDAIGELAREQGLRIVDAPRRERQRGAASGRGADAVMHVEAMPVGTQEIIYYGNVSTLYSVQMALKTYRASDGELLWSSPTMQVNFTSLNAAEKAREALEPVLGAVEDHLRDLR